MCPKVLICRLDKLQIQLFTSSVLNSNVNIDSAQRRYNNLRGVGKYHSPISLLHVDITKIGQI